MLVIHSGTKAQSLKTGPNSAAVAISLNRRCKMISTRTFWWGARSKWGCRNSGKVQKSLYNHRLENRGRSPKDAGCLLDVDRRYFRISQPHDCGRNYWRSLTHWNRHDRARGGGRDRDQPGSEEQGVEDWFSRREKAVQEQYNLFRERVESDPYNALFGASNRWLGWIHDDIRSATDVDRTANSPRDQARDSSHYQEHYKSHSQPDVGLPKDTSSGKQETPKNMRTYNESQNDYEIDPITLRKLPKAVEGPLNGQGAELAKDDTVNIPVKQYTPRNPQSNANKGSSIPSSQAEDPADSESQTWLAREGFARKEIRIKIQSTQTSPSDAHSEPPTRIETALDRHQNKAADPSKPKDKTSKVSQNANLETLNPSYTLSEAGKMNQDPAGKPQQHGSRKKELEEKFDKRSSELDELLASEISANPRRLHVAAKADHGHSDLQDLNVSAFSNPVTDMHPTLSEGMMENEMPIQKKDAMASNTKITKIRAKLVPLKTKLDMLREEYQFHRQELLNEKRRFESAEKTKSARKARAMLDAEIKQQKDAMQTMLSRSFASPKISKADNVSHELVHGEGDVASNVHEFLGRNRWYKQKAPHAQGMAEAKLKRLARENAFVKEIRGIYEDTYGPINVEHRQHTIKEAESPSAKHQESGSVDSLLANLVTQDLPADLEASKRLEMTSQELLPLEKGISNDLRALLFNLDDFQHRAASESRVSEQAAIAKTGAKAITESGIKLMLAGLRLASSGGALNHEELIAQIKGVASQQGSKSIADVKIPPSTESETEIETLHTKDTSPQNTETATYRILAYDATAQRVNSGKIAAQALSPEEQPLTPLQALNKLHNPGKFLPPLMTLHNKGYDIVSGAPDILVLKKTRRANPQVKDGYMNFNGGRTINPIDGTAPPAVYTGNFASPTGFVNLDPLIPPEEQQVDEKEPLTEEPKVQQHEQQQPQDHKPVIPPVGKSASPTPPHTSSNGAAPAKERHGHQKVQRREEVFSGGNSRPQMRMPRPSRRQRRRARRRRTIVRMLLFGTTAAGICYVAGVFMEPRRTKRGIVS